MILDRPTFFENWLLAPVRYESELHNQQPWAKRSDRPCLVTYNATSAIDEGLIVERRWFQHIVHGVTWPC